ncbi:ABC transporter A family member 8-like [Apium graveolens]|uniref:ABC transporter A family member 8-like n=1 Tax=Apium graveolens TaxID=4045 RepID=UPI003D7A66FF
MSRRIETCFLLRFIGLYLQPKCTPNSTFPVTIRGASPVTVQQVESCVHGLQFWRNSSYDINDELYKLFRKGNSGREINEIIAGYDLLNSDVSNFNVSIWYNSTLKNDTDNRPIALIRVPLLVNLSFWTFYLHFSAYFLGRIELIQ